MTWRVPTWYRAHAIPSPYKEFERWRWSARLIFYPYAALLIVPLVWAIFQSDEAKVEWITALRGFGSSLGGETARMTFVFVLEIVVLAILYLPFFFFIYVSSIAVRRRLRQMSGRCLNCGSIRQSEFLDECSACDRSLAEQDGFRDAARCRISWRAPARVRSERSEFRRLWKATVIVTAGWCLAALIVVVCLETEQEGSNSSAIALAAAMVSSIAPLILGRRYRLRVLKTGLLRLRCRCLACGSPLGATADVCEQCRQSVIAQQLYILRLIRTWRKELERRKHADELIDAYGLHAYFPKAT